MHNRIGEKNRVSVIVPVYNAEKYLERCICSILEQSYSDLELILVDDGSKDRSLEICNSCRKKDNRVKVFSVPNSGPAAARNIGLENMTGAYLMFVDSDDWIEKDALETAVRAITETESELVLFRFYIGAEPKGAQDGCVCAFDREQILGSIISGETSGFSKRGYCVDGLWAKVYRTDFIRNNHIRLPEKLFRGEDSVFSLYLYELAKKVTFHPARFYHYEENGDSLCNRFSENAVRSFPEILKENDRFLEKYYKHNEFLKTANDRSVFPRMIEAETNYFFHRDNKKTRRERYGEYRALLRNTIVHEHILQIKSSGLNRNQKMKRIMYRYPLYILFLIYPYIVYRKDRRH